MHKESEVFGVNYERFSLGKKLKNFVKEYNINTVCELPAHGAKAAPSLYSFDFAHAGLHVTLVNGDQRSAKFYEALNIRKNIHFVDVPNIDHTEFNDNSFDFVWNFAFIPTYPDKEALIKEMMRISKKYVAVFSVNKRNIGFPLHKFAHWRTKIQWTHGDINFNSPKFLKEFMASYGLKNLKIGVVDCPVWPDSVGFRDIRLHRNPVNFSQFEWEIPYIDYVKSGRFPRWFLWVYLIEKLPLPLIIKFLYAHIFYIIGEKI
ncbi:MAG: methyltransferase domain-containing protein [Candidatus Omnitrophota bacterium]